jgi:hypothetical protein
MRRIAHIAYGQIVNVSLASDDWMPPENGTQMLEEDAVAAGIPRWVRPIAFEPAPSWKVKVWLIRQGLSLADIEATIRQAIGAGAEQDEAILRWQHAPEFPFDHPLVGLVAEALDLDVAAAWPEILAI